MYFESNVLKGIVAHIVVNYDLKLGGDPSRPPNLYVASAIHSRLVSASHSRSALEEVRRLDSWMGWDRMGRILALLLD